MELIRAYGLSGSREGSLQSLHDDLLRTLSTMDEHEVGTARSELREVLRRMEELVAVDAEARTRRLRELDDKQRQLAALHDAVQRQEAGSAQAVAEACRESIGQLTDECRRYQADLEASQAENATLRRVRGELGALRTEGQEVVAALEESRTRAAEAEAEAATLRDKAETLAVHLVESVRERQEGEREAATLRERLREAETRLAAFEEAASADIEEFAARDVRVTEELRERTREVGRLRGREEALAAELQEKGREAEAALREADALRCRDDALSAELRDRTRDAEAAARQAEGFRERGDALAAELAARCEQGEAADGLRRSLQNLSGELSDRCEQVATLTLKLKAATASLAESDEALNALREEARRIHRMADGQASAHRAEADGLRQQLARRETELAAAAEEAAAAVRRAEAGCAGEVERATEARTADARAAEARVKELERVLEKERRAKEELSQSVVELQRQTIELAQEKGKLAAEVGRHLQGAASIRSGTANTVASSFHHHSVQRVTEGSSAAVVAAAAAAAAGGGGTPTLHSSVPPLGPSALSRSASLMSGAGGSAALGVGGAERRGQSGSGGGGGGGDGGGGGGKLTELEARLQRFQQELQAITANPGKVNPLK